MNAVAVWVSRLFHPFVVPVPMLVVALLLLGVGWREAFAWTALCVGVAIVPPTVLLVALLYTQGAPRVLIAWLAAAVALVAWSGRAA